MTVVNPKSISGINSITTGSGSDNLLTIHTSDANNTERVRVNSSGDVIVGSGVTLSPDGDAFFTGVCTATSFVGNGSGLTNLATDLVNDTSPQLGGDLDTNSHHILVDDDHQIRFGDSNDFNIQHNTNENYIQSNSGHIYIRANVDDDEGDNIYIQAKSGEDSIVAHDDGAVELYHDGTKQCETSANGLAFPSGKGIDFSATSDSAGATSELLDDYEEGLWTPTTSQGFNSVSYSIQRGWYVKIGNLLHASFFLRFSASGAGTHIRFAGIPYASANLTPAYSSGGNVIFTNLPGIDLSANIGQQSIFIGGNYSYFELYNNGNSSSSSGSSFSDKDIYGHLTYRTG